MTADLRLQDLKAGEQADFILIDVPSCKSLGYSAETVPAKELIVPNNLSTDTRYFIIMCGRFAYFGNGFFGYESLQYPKAPPFESYNITPSQNIPALVRDPESQSLDWSMLHWGLIPFWSKSKQTKFNLINARAEGIESKPSFRGPFKFRRCIIPASGFYEWRQMENGKQPYFIRPADGGYFAFAGIWDHWEGGGEEVVESCSIITTNANNIMASIHDRMPVILEEKDCLLWLDVGAKKEQLLKVLRPCPENLIEAYPVTTRVNRPRNNDPECIKRSG